MNSSPEFRADSLRHASVHAGGVSVLSQAAVAAIHLAGMMVLGRLLPPSDFGIMSMALGITAFAGVFRDVGLTTAAVQSGSLSPPEHSALFYVNVVAGCLLALVVCLLAPLAAWFYSRPELLTLTLLLSCTFVAAGLGAQHGAALRREMRFGPVALAAAVGAAATFITSTGLAASGSGYWSLAWGVVAGSALSSALLILLSPLKLVRPAPIASIRKLLGFGGHVTGFELANFVHRNADNILIGRVLGAPTLGLYDRAYQLATLPVTLIRGPLISAALPAMSRLRNQPDLFRTYFRRLCSLIALATMPLAAFIAISSENLIGLILGADWLESAPLLTLLAAAGFIQPVSGLRGAVVLAMGHSRAYMRWGILNSLVIGAGFVIGIHWGATGVASAYAIINYVLLIPSLKLAFVNTTIRLTDFGGAIWRPAAASIAAAIITSAVASISSLLEPWPVFLMQSVIFAASFTTAFVLLPGGVRELMYQWSLVRSLIGREPA